MSGCHEVRPLLPARPEELTPEQALLRAETALALQGPLSRAVLDAPGAEDLIGRGAEDLPALLAAVRARMATRAGRAILKRRRARARLRGERLSARRPLAVSTVAYDGSPDARHATDVGTTGDRPA